MEIRKFDKKNLKKFEFVNDYGYTSYGFYHNTTLFENGVIIMTNRCNYINRTWENYAYQTVMLGAVRKLLDNRETVIKAEYKRINNIKRLTKEKKTEIEKVVKQDKRIKELTALRTELRGKVW